jgi:hypothetical protein
LQIPLPGDISDTTTTQGWIYNALTVQPTEEVELFVITRIAQAPTTTRAELKAGDLVSVFKFKARISHRNSSGDTPYFIDSELAPGGIVNVNVFAVDGDTLLLQSVDATNLPTKVGEVGRLHSKVNGIDTSYAATYTSSDMSVARVDSTGYVEVVGVGTYNITSHIAGCVDTITTTITTQRPDKATSDGIDELPVAGGVVNITGTNLTAIKAITIDGIAVDEFAKLDSGNQVFFVAPPHPAGNVVIKIDGYWGDDALELDTVYV